MTKYKKKNLILEDYEEKFSYNDAKNQISISFNRVAFVFFIFVTLTIIFSIKSGHFGFKNASVKQLNIKKKDYRATITDRNGNILAKTINIINAGINPNLVIDKKKIILNLKLIFPKKKF